MDFITKLLASQEPLTGVIYDSILVVIDRLTSYAYLLLYLEASNIRDLAYIVIRTVFAQYGTPKEIISDRDKLFKS